MTKIILNPDKAQAIAYLKKLAPGETRFTFQTLAEGSNKHKTKLLNRMLHGTLDQHWHTLVQKNRQGAGVYIVPNQTNLKGRKIENMTGIRAVWQEDDAKGDTPALPVDPHIVVESSPGKFHRYILTNADELFPLEGHELSAEFKPVQKRLTDDYGSDPGAGDLPHLLRVPGFYHRKGKPVRVELRSVSDSAPLPWSEIKTIFPPVEPTNTRTENIQYDPDDFAANLLTDDQVTDITAALCFLAKSPLTENEISKGENEFWLDERNNYITAGMWLKRYGDTGKEIWLKSCGLSDRFDEVDALERWAKFKPTRAGYEAVLRKAQDRGWTNPKSKDQSSPQHTQLDIVRLSDVQEKPINWLWHKRIALGKVTMIAGDPGLGKSMLTCALAAHVTTGKCWPVESHPCPQGEVILVGAEDALDDTVKPRLLAAGADPKKVTAFSMVYETDTEGRSTPRPFSLKDDMHMLAEHLYQHRACKLIVVDPISAFLGKGTDSNSNSEIRALLHPLSELAEKYQIAVICVSHLNKGGGNSATYRVMGSLAFVAAARASFIVTRDPEDSDKRLFLAGKNNIGNDSGGYSYTIKETEKEVPYIVWDDEAENRDASEVLGDSPKKRTTLDNAKEWLEDQLCFGSDSVETIRTQAEKDGFSWRTINRAKKEMGVISTRAGGTGKDGKWLWQLPEATEQEQAA